jgi:uncharacterized repeat protein (TIGR01451 family)
MKKILGFLVLGLVLSGTASATRTTNTLITKAGGVIEIDPNGNIVWQYDQVDHSVDAKRLSNGNTLITDTTDHRVIEVNSDGTIVWQYGETGVAGSGDNQLNHPTDAERLSNGNTLIVDRYNDRVIEIEPAGTLGGTIVWQYGGTNYLNDPIDVEKLLNGNILIADSHRERVIELDLGGNIVWQYGQTDSIGSGDNELYRPWDAERLANGNTLIADYQNYRVIEVEHTGTEGGTIVWQYGGVYGSGTNQLGGPFDVERLSNGNTLIVDIIYSRVIEVNSSKTIVWQKVYPDLISPRDVEEILNPDAVYNTAYMYYQNLDNEWMAYATGWVVTYIEYVPAVGTPNITLTKEVDPTGTQTSGTELTYTITYNNIGNGTATNCVLYDAIPENSEYVGGSAQVVSGKSATIYYSTDGGSTWSTTEPADASTVTNLKWVFTEDIEPGASGSCSFSVRIK